MAGIKRMVIVPIDDALRMFKDYLGDHIPADAMPAGLAHRPSDRTLGLIVTGNSWEGDKGEVRVDFEIKRVFKS